MNRIIEVEIVESIKIELWNKLLHKYRIAPSPDYPVLFPDCWNYNTSTCIEDRKYGTTIIRGRRYLVTRISAYINKLLDPNGIEFTLDSIYMVLHKCDNPPCFNPNHLYVGTAKNNSDDKITRNRINVNGIRRNSKKVTNNKHSVEAILEIRKLFAQDVSCHDLMIRFNIPYQTVCKIVQRHTWKHI